MEKEIITKRTFGLLLILIGLALGLYCGLWWAFIGGIISVIEQVRAPQLNGVILGFGILKMMFAALIGYVSGFIVILPGAALFSSRK